MPLTYAGVDLSPRTPALAVVMSRWWSDNAPDVWDHPGYSLERLHHLPVPDRPDPEPARLNALVWPTGASRWPVFHGLIGGKQLADVVAAVGQVAPTAAPLKIDDGNGGVVSPDMFLLHVKPVFVAGQLDERLWQITLVGRSYFWWQRQLTYTFAAGDSWTTLLTNLVTAAAGLTPTVPAVPGAYGSPNPLRWSAPARPLPPLIDAAAASVGLRFVQNLDGTVKYVAAPAANAADQTQYTQFAATDDALAAGGRSTVADLAGQIPANVAVGFWGDVQAIVSVSLASLALPEFVSATGAPLTGVANTSAWVMLDQRAGSTSPTPSSAANQAATDYYRWLLSQTDAVFRGVKAWQPTGQEDRVEWEYRPGEWDHASADPRDPNDRKLPWERVVTRVCRQELGDKNQYGDRPPPGWSYAVRVTGKSGSAYTATVRTVNSVGDVVDGPELGFGLSAQAVLRSADPARTFATGDYAVAIPDPLTPYSWLGVPAVAGPGGGDCSSCAWLNDVPPDVCWTLYRRGGKGRCACFAVDDPADPNAGVVMQASGGGTEWYALAMVDTCCGCGGAALRLAGSAATLTLGNVHVSCNGGSGSGSGSGGGIFQLTLNSDCCGVLDDGRRFVQFTGWGPDACNGTREGNCDNTFTIIAVCGTTCPPPVCDCLPCGPCCNTPAPRAYKANVTGFADDHWNGIWVWTYIGGCTWVGTCAKSGSYTSTLFYDASTLPTPTMRLTHGGAIFENTSFGCCSNGNVLSKVSGTGPASVTVDPAVDCGVCTPEWPDTLTLTILNITFGGVPGGCYLYPVGTQITLTKVPGFNPASPQWWNHDPTVVYACCGTPGDHLTGNIVFACDGGAINACVGFGVSMTEGDGPTSMTPLEPCSCSPIFYHGSGTRLRNVGTTCNGAELNTVTIEVEVSA